jgi:hypothetical protein
VAKRQIVGLEWARQAAPDEAPFAGVRRRKGPKAAGQRYERALARALPTADPGLWWEFCDANGPGWCQTDLLWHHEGQVAVLEVKLTDWGEAKDELLGLYVPVLGLALGRPVRPIVVAKTLTRASAATTVYPSLRKALASTESVPIVQWLGHTSPL